MFHIKFNNFFNEHLSLVNFCFKSILSSKNERDGAKLFLKNDVKDG